jgi:hypothetical protein
MAPGFRSHFILCSHASPTTLVRYRSLAAEENPQTKLPMNQPGVGPNRALDYVLTIGDVSRFRRERQVASYLGLIPREESSGGRQKLGAITAFQPKIFGYTGRPSNRNPRLGQCLGPRRLLPGYALVQRHALLWPRLGQRRDFRRFTRKMQTGSLFS